MMVLVIVGLMSSAVILSWPQDKPVMQSYAEGLVRDLNGVAQNSLLTGRTSALGLSEDAYAIYTFEKDEWIERQTAEWPEGVFVSFENETAKLKLSDEVVPLALFEPTGQSSVFTLTLKDHDDEIQIASAGDGRISFVSAQ